MGFALKLAGTDKTEIRKRVGEAADMLDLDAYLDRKPKALSGGQRQRVAMGRAIVRQPQVFLMDEPLSNLDAKLRVQTRTQIAQLQRRLGTTTVYVTHDQVEAMTMGDRVAVLKGGVLQQCASPRELYRRPANVFVAGFMGSPVDEPVHRARHDGGVQLRRPAGPRAPRRPGRRRRARGRLRDPARAPRDRRHRRTRSSRSTSSRNSAPKRSCSGTVTSTDGRADRAARRLAQPTREGRDHPCSRRPAGSPRVLRGQRRTARPLSARNALTDHHPLSKGSRQS